MEAIYSGTILNTWKAVKRGKSVAKNSARGKTYHIAASDYLAKGKEDRLGFFKADNFVKLEIPKENDASDLRSDVRRAVVAYLKSIIR